MVFGRSEMTIKDTLADIGIEIFHAFLHANPAISTPVLNLYRDKKDTMCQRISGFATCGYYRNNAIHIGVPLCASMNPMYSWAGYISDRTPYGVIQHELGHHVDQVMSGYDVYKKKSVNGNFSDKIMALSGEKPITSYSPNTMEWFAEIFRLFVTNPDLLKMIRPKAHQAILDSGLVPVVEMSANSVLNQFHAPARVFERMDKWITTGK